MLSFFKRNDDRKELEELKQEYKNELEKLKQKVSDYDTTVLTHYNTKLREENKILKELIQVYEKFTPQIETEDKMDESSIKLKKVYYPQNKSQTLKTTIGKERL